MSLAEIARMTGVSTSTVSRALNNSPLVREETAKRIREAMHQIGYTPNTTRAKSGGRRGRGKRDSVKHRRIAVIMLGQIHSGWNMHPVIGSFVSGVTSAAREFDVDVLLDDMPEPDQPSRLVNRGDIGGAILLIDSAAARSRHWAGPIENLAARLPVVWAMGGHTQDLPLDHILPDNLGIGRMAADYLRSRGCERVVTVTNSPHWPLTRQRLMMFASTALDSGMDLKTYLVTDQPRVAKVYAGQVSLVPTLEAAAEAMAGDRPDGVFCPRDHELSQLYPALIQTGLRPGEALHAIACDNDQTQLMLMSPRPATIDINPREVARIAIRRLRSRMQHHLEAPMIINVLPTLIDPSGQPVAHPSHASQAGVTSNP